MMKYLQRLGRAIMQPVAVLPLAGLLLGIGYWIDPSGWGANSAIAAFLIKAGGAIIDNLPILFAVGIAYGMSKDGNGAAALSGLVAFLTVTTLLSEATVGMLRGGAEVLTEEGFGKINNAFIGILSGLVAAACYDRFHQTKLPDALAFFSGRRLTPIVTSFIMILVSGILYFVWPKIYGGLVTAGNWMVERGAVGAGLFGFFNRLLIPAGLHHALNAVFWFDTIGIGDLTHFFDGTGTVGVTGMYMGGFFPIMMFGLPGAALAMYHAAKPEKKKTAYGLLLSASLASFLVGLTEPIEFAFMFLAPGLYFIHALLTGVSLLIANLFHATSGFGFSAGAIDFILSLKNPVANRPWILILMGLVFFAVYYVLFRFFITKFNLKTPGREDDDLAYTEEKGEADKKVLSKATDFNRMAKTIVQGLGGKENIDRLDYCSTRLRVEVKDDAKVNEQQIKSAGASGIMKPGKNALQVIIGQQVQFVYDEIQKMI
ncbi:MAG: N-acetylglucosamine-specific PTS transporter subunit IIBC [Ezakiella sp.]|nr:N-acetylglucosamine-specific PTS transporter subunit IIBC [Ezakiella sp.]